MTALHTDSAPYEVGYGKPPRRTQFRKGQSGNPGGRPRREPIERLKALTLQEAYRGVVIKREDGVAEPALAIQAILRSQIELAMNGNIRAQHDILTAVRTFEREEAIGAAVDACAEVRVRQAADLEERMRAAKRAALAAPAREMSYTEAARRVAYLLGLCKPKSETTQSETTQSETRAAGNETVTEERDAERSTAATLSADGVPSADRAPRPEDDTASAAPPAASPPLSAEPPADPRPRRPQPDRYARRRARESAPSPRADVRAGRVHNRLLRNRCLNQRTGNSARPFNLIWKEVTSRHSRRGLHPSGETRKSGNSLLNSLFSGNAGAGPRRVPQRHERAG